MGSPYAPDLPDPDEIEDELARHFADRRIKVSTLKDMVSTPDHYARFKIEPIRFIAENGLNWFQGNVVKYILRHDAKNGLEDILKSIRYSLMYYGFLQGHPKWSEPDPFMKGIKEYYATGGDHA